MVYDIEFLRRVDGKAETLALDMVRLVSQGLTDVIVKADELFQQIPVLPRPDGYRIRESDGPVVLRVPAENVIAAGTAGRVSGVNIGFDPTQPLAA